MQYIKTMAGCLSIETNTDQAYRQHCPHIRYTYEEMTYRHEKEHDKSRRGSVDRVALNTVIKYVKANTVTNQSDQRRQKMRVSGFANHPIQQSAARSRRVRNKKTEKRIQVISAEGIDVLKDPVQISCFIRKVKVSHQSESDSIQPQKPFQPDP